MTTAIDKLREALGRIAARVGFSSDWEPSDFNVARAALDELSSTLAKSAFETLVELFEIGGTDCPFCALDANDEHEVHCVFRQLPGAKPIPESELDEAWKPNESERTARTAETEEQAAERDLGAWLVAHPGWTGLVMRGRIDGAGPWTHYRVELKPPEQEALFSGWLTSPASAIRAALAKARGGEGRWHG